MLYTHGEIPPYPHQPELSCFFNEKLEAHSNSLVDVQISVWSPLRYDDAVRHSVQIAHIHTSIYPRIGIESTSAVSEVTHGAVHTPH